MYVCMYVCVCMYAYGSSSPALCEVAADKSVNPDTCMRALWCLSNQNFTNSHVQTLVRIHTHTTQHHTHVSHYTPPISPSPLPSLPHPSHLSLTSPISPLPLPSLPHFSHLSLTSPISPSPLPSLPHPSHLSLTPPISPSPLPYLPYPSHISLTPPQLLYILDTVGEVVPRYIHKVAVVEMEALNLLAK